MGRDARTAAPIQSWLDFSDAPKVLALAVPAMLAFLTQTLVNIVDTYFFGLLEEPERSDGQAMLSLALPLLWAVGGFFSAISVGTQAMVARRVGAGEAKESGRVLANAVVLSMVASLIASVLGFYAIPYAYSLASHDPAYIEIGSTYTQWRFVGVVSMVVTSAYKAFFDGTGRTYVHFVAAIVMNIVNLVLCWLLIFGNWGFPRMGVEGAGVAAAGSSWVGLLTMIVFSVRREDRERYGLYVRGLLSRRAMMELAKLSVPSGVATTVVMTGFILFRQIVQLLDSAHLRAGGEGAVYGAATTIILQILSITFFAALAFGVATATLVSQRLGAGDPDGAERYAWSSVRIGVLAFGALGALEAIFPATFIAIFNDSPEVIRVGSSSLRLMGACGPLIAAGMILTQALFGAGNTRFVMIAELVLHFFVLVPGAYVFGVMLQMGLFGVWLSGGIYALLLTILMAWKFREGAWKNIRI